jgi:predicted dehydrogenase
MTKITRRRFIEQAAMAAGLTLIPRYVLGGKGYTAPSDKLNIAGIGVGGQGAGDIHQVKSENIVALCDVDWARAKDTFNAFPGAQKYDDFRVMLDKQKDIDAVIVATADHTHAVATMTALKMGKHVYCEKPLTYSVYEARMVSQEARKQNVATQMGNQGHASESIRLLCEWIWDGAIGPIREVHAWTPHPVWPQGMDRPSDTPPVPETLKWDLWLGPAPSRPYHPVYLPMLWRGWWDFGTGGLGDMGCHIFDHIFWSLKLGHPKSVEASCSYFVREALNWDKVMNTESYPRASLVHYRFPARGDMPPVKLTWYDGGLMPPRPEELEEGRTMGDQFGGTLYIGDKGTILTGSHGANGLRIIPESKMQAYKKPPKTLKRSIGHHREWIEACKGGEPAKSNFADFAGPLTEVVLLGNIALRTGKKLNWDAENMKFPNYPDAEQFLHRKYRDGWSL